LAKGELFKGKLAQWMLPKLNMIPVYRKQDDPNQMDKNAATFEKCFEHLERGGAILMFPEGTSITERKLRPIKTGAARIVLGAEERNDFNLGVKVITIGLNYENPHRFNRTLFVNIDKAIDVKTLRNRLSRRQFCRM
jgi:glycerol-3-phosphate O-acyltransferase/dihydroxyacetone phosphate acyltransferase